MLSPTIFCTLFASVLLAVGQAPKPAVTESGISALLKRYDTANQKFLAALKAAKSRTERGNVKKELRPKPVPNAGKLVEWAATKPKHKLAAHVLMLVIAHGGRSKSALNAASLLAKNHRDLPPEKFDSVVRSMDLPPGLSDSFFTVFQKHATRRGTKARAFFVHALFKVGVVRYAQMISTPELARELEKHRGKDLIEYLRKINVTETNAEAARLFERILTEFPDVKLGGKRLADLAKPPYYAVTRTAIGKTAPEIVGKDVHGKPMKLSDYRGKVVVISFWSTSCKPCMRMLPREKKLVDRMQGKPFVLLGVNADTDRKKLESAIKTHEITWPNFWDGGDSKPTISKTWLVGVWPTIVVLDHKGIIRYKHLRGRKLDETVERLVKQAEQ